MSKIVSMLGPGLGQLLFGNSFSGAPKTTTPSVPTDPNASQTVGSSPNLTGDADNLGRAALIKTSSMGVLGTDDNGRRKLLGNE